MTANTPNQNEPGGVPRRHIVNKVSQEPVCLLDTDAPTAAPDQNFEGIQINFHEGFMVQIAGVGNVSLYGRLREDLPWVVFDTVDVDALGLLKNYWGVPLLAARANSVTTPIKVWVI